MANYYDNKNKLREIFEDTQEWYITNNTLKDSVKYSKEHTIIYNEDNYPDISNKQIRNKTIVEVSKNRSFQQATIEYKNDSNKKICVLNFASATNPGGGVKKGSSAQEEALCRCSTLYPALDQYECHKNFYTYNKNLKDVLHNDRIIYSPDILIIKSDERFPKRLDEKDFIKVDIISCSAPNLRDNRNSYADSDTGEVVKISEKKLYELHVSRAKHILHIAVYNNIDVLILGAFGAGAFKNDPRVVANAYNDVLEDYYKYFDKIVFAVYCNQYDSYNYDSFNNIIVKRR